MEITLPIYKTLYSLSLNIFDIVKNFKEEILIVKQNQKLLEKFENNIQTKINKIWSN